jgi:hypothetical protein
MAGMIAVTGAILPVSAVAQTAADVSDQIRKLQDAIGTIQKESAAASSFPANSASIRPAAVSHSQDDV